MQNRLFITLYHQNNISQNILSPTLLAQVSRETNNLIATVLHELHVLHNPFATFIFACPSGLSNCDHKIICSHYISVVAVTVTKHRVFDCASWTVNKFGKTPSFLLLFQQDFDDTVADAYVNALDCNIKEESNEKVHKKEESSLCDVSASLSGEKKEEYVNDDDKFSSPQSFATAQSEGSSSPSCTRSASQIAAPCVDDILQDDLESLLSAPSDDDDDNSTCSYDVQRMDAFMVQTRAMKQRLKDDEEKLNMLNKDFGFHPIPFGERLVEMRNATNPLIGPCTQDGFERAPEAVHLPPAKQGGPEHDKYNDDLHNAGNPIAKIVNNISRRFDRIGKTVTCTCETRKRCQASSHANNECELCTKQVKQPKFHHARASFTTHDQNEIEGTGCIDLLCRGHRDLVLVLVISSCGTHLVLALPAKSKKTKDLLPVTWRLFSLARYFYGVSVWRLHGDRESALFHARNEFAPILCTFTISGDHSANPISERFNRTLSIMASKAMSHITSSATRKNMWSRAVTWAAHALSMQNINHKDCTLKERRMCNQTVIPFMSLGTVPPKLGLKPSRTEGRNEYAVYLAPCDITPMASLVLLIAHDKNSATSTSCNGTKIISTRGFNPKVDDQNYPLLPNVLFPDKEVDEVTVICTVCGLQRSMELDQHTLVMERFPDGNFTCKETNATCGESQWDLCRVRKGRKIGSLARVTKASDCTADPSVFDIIDEDASFDLAPDVFSVAATNGYSNFDKADAQAVTQAEKDRLKMLHDTGKRDDDLVPQRRATKQQRRYKNWKQSKDDKIAQAKPHVLLAKQNVSDSTTSTPMDHSIIDADFLPDYNHGINADIDEMMEDTRCSLRDMCAFKAKIASDMVDLGHENLSVNLTKLLTEKDDLETKESRDAIKVESHQLFDVDEVVAPPVEEEQALKDHPDATASPAMLIVSIKNYEFMLTRKSELKQQVKLARESLNVECKHILDEYRDATSATVSLSGLANDGTLKRRAEKAIALEARIKELDEIADMIRLEDAQEDGSEFVPLEFKIDTSCDTMKGASSAEPKWKCRVVVRGDIVQRLDDFISQPIFRPTKPGDDAPSVWSPTVSLAGFRSVVAHSVLHKFELRSLDLPSAFVQVSWPDHLPPHFLRFPENIREVMSSEYQGKGLKSPVWRMIKMIYGHRLSGWTFCRRLHEILLANGFVPCNWCSAVMVHPDKNICMCTYVDDLAFSCDTAGENFLMNCIRDGGLKIGDEAEACKKYLGTKITVIREKGASVVRLDQHEYAIAICEMYKELFGKLPNCRKFPGSWNVNLSSEPQRDLHRATPCGTGELSEDANRRRRQVMVGMLLWHARSVRCDISGYVNYLATRIHIWSARDDTFLAQLIGYLRFSAAKALTWNIPDNVKLSVNVLFDANLHVPRSQCSYTVALGNSENQCYALIDWANKRAQLSCTASAASELCAAHYTSTNVTGMCQFLDECIHSCGAEREFPDTNYQLLGDNISSLLVIQKGFTPMAGAWASNRAYGLRLAVMHQQFACRVFRLGHVRSAVNTADLASKVTHSRETFLFMAEMCGLCFGRPRFKIPIERDSLPNRKLVRSLIGDPAR